MENTMSMQENVMQMMGSEMQLLEAELSDAKLAYADITLDDGDYRCRDERKTKCKVIEGQIDLIQKLMDKVSSMTMEIKMPAFRR